MVDRGLTVAIGGHVARCENEECGHTVIAYNSCRNRHCLNCQGAAARDWLKDREAELLPVPYFHVVYTRPAPIADLAYTNKAVIYDILFKASAQATLTIAAHGFQLPSFLLHPGEMHDAHYLNTRRTCASHCKLVRRRCLGR
jgi:hypothetical protein